MDSYPSATLVDDFGEHEIALVFVAAPTISAEDEYVCFPVDLQAVIKKECYFVDKENIKYPIIGKLPTPINNQFVVCKPDLTIEEVLIIVRKIEMENALEIAADNLSVIRSLYEKEVIPVYEKAVDVLVKSLSKDTEYRDRGWKYPDKQPATLSEVREYWERYVEKEFMDEDDAEKSTAVAIKMIVNSSASLPNVADLVLKPTPEDNLFLKRVKKIFAGLVDVPDSVLEDNDSNGLSRATKLWMACHESPLATFLFTCMDEVGFNIGRVMYLCLEFQDTDAVITETDSTNLFVYRRVRRIKYLLERLSLREIRLVSQKHKVINEDYNTLPFIFDWNKRQNQTLMEKIANEGIDAWKARLHLLLGFNPEELNLNRCGITGSSMCFIMAPYNSTVMTALTSPLQFTGDSSAIGAIPEGKVKDGYLTCQAFNKEGCRTIGQLSQKHDIDIAAFVTKQEHLDDIAREIYSVVKKHYPNCILKKVKKSAGNNWVIITEDPKEFVRLPKIEIYPTTLAGICTHHVAPVRGCWTAAYGGNGVQRPIVTATFIRAQILKQMDNFNYFASRKTFPQEIIFKYTKRGYDLGVNIPGDLMSEMVKYAARHIGENPWCTKPVKAVGKGIVIGEYLNLFNTPFHHCFDANENPKYDCLRLGPEEINHMDDDYDKKKYNKLFDTDDTTDVDSD